MSAAYERVVQRLESRGSQVRNHVAKCPAHDDRNPSLSVNEGDDGKALITCHAGCSRAAVLSALNLSDNDLFPPADVSSRDRVVAEYRYVDEAGRLLYEVLRKKPKGFSQRKPRPGGGWEYKTADVRKVLYRLPDVIAAVAAGRPVYVVEGEKDADRLAHLGICATTSPGGAGKWLKVMDAPKVLTDGHVVIVADDDAPGFAHAGDVARSLRDVARSVQVVKAAVGKDISDHLASGRSVDEVVFLADHPFPECANSLDDWLNLDVLGSGVLDDDDAVSAPTNTESSDADESDLDESWLPVDLRPVLAGNYVQPLPDWLVRRDGMALLYPGSINGLHGDSGSGKGWVVCFAIAEAARRNRATLLVDYEDTAVSITARLLLLSMTPEEILRWFVYVRPQVSPGPRAVAHLCELVAQHDVALVVIDSIGEAFATEGLDENKDVEVGPWYRRVARPLADTGAAVLLVDHSTKAADNQLHPSGSKRKRAAITGASYFAEAIAPFVKGEGGRLQLTCAKDRHGNYRRGEAVGSLVMTYSAGGTCHLDLYEPDLSTSNVDGDDIKMLMAARHAVAAVRAEFERAGAADDGSSGTLSGNSLLAAMKFKAKTDLKRAGIELAISRGCLSITNGPRGAKLHTFVKDFDGTQ